MKIGITGSTGFISSTVAGEFKRHGHQILSLDPWVREDYQNDKELKQLDWVFHFGAKTSIPGSSADPFGTLSSNLNSTIKALKIAEQQKAKFIYLSSYVYGPPQYVPVDEKHNINVTNPYMGSKFLGEEVCRQMSKFCSIPLVILRAFNIYGHVFKQGRLISDILSAYQTQSPFTLNNPNPRRDYLYVKDFILLLHRIVDANDLSNVTFNVGSGKSYSNIEVIEKFNKLIKEPLNVQIDYNPRQNDILECVADISKIQETFSWEPRYSLKQGLSEIISEIQLNRDLAL